MGKIEPATHLNVFSTPNTLSSLQVWIILKNAGRVGANAHHRLLLSTCMIMVFFVVFSFDKRPMIKNASLQICFFGA